MNFVEPSLEIYSIDEKERSLLAWILYALAWSALSRGMGEIGATLSHFLMRRSVARVPGVTACCFLAANEVDQAMAGWVSMQKGGSLDYA